MKIAYAERLGRSDFSEPLRAAVAARDPATDRLFAAVARFLDSLPAWVLARAPLLGRRTLRPALGGWYRLDASARREAWAIYRPFRAADRRAAWRIGGPLLAPALLIGGRDAGRLARMGQALAEAWLWAASKVHAVVDGLRSR